MNDRIFNLIKELSKEIEQEKMLKSSVAIVEDINSQQAMNVATYINLKSGGELDERW